jgi:hypothetical protein
MANENQVLILRDGEGNFYLIGSDAIEAGKVPADKRAAIEQALSGDVAGFFFDDRNFQSAFTSLRQSNAAVGSNTMIGGLNVLSPQTLNQVQGNIANVGTSQSSRQ